jgi:hypothetical protein
LSTFSDKLFRVAFKKATAKPKEVIFQTEQESETKNKKQQQNEKKLFFSN